MSRAATPRYTLDDQRERLGKPPWSGAVLLAWETAHGHDARLPCYPEHGCLIQFARADAHDDLVAALRELVSLIPKKFTTAPAFDNARALLRLLDEPEPKP